jgi:hypothetical protein
MATTPSVPVPIAAPGPRRLNQVSMVNVERPSDAAASKATCDAPAKARA